MDTETSQVPVVLYVAVDDDQMCQSQPPYSAEVLAQIRPGITRRGGFNETFPENAAEKRQRVGVSVMNRCQTG